MAEFTAFSTACVKAVKPEVMVEHNLSLVTGPWQSGTSDLVAETCDSIGGDLYGGYMEQTFICKYYRNLSKVLPFEYITSRCDPDLRYHTTTKSEDEIVLHAITALVHNGALSICDGANPDGTLCEDVYMGVVKRAFKTTMPYEKYMSGNLIADVAVWFANRSKYDWKENGKLVGGDALPDMDTNDFIRNPLKMCQIMREENIPFDVLPSSRLSHFSGKLLVISDVVNIRDSEMQAIEAFVRNGGSLYISGHIGHPRLFALLEAQADGMTERKVTYMRPTAAGKRFFADFNAVSPMAVQGSQEILRFQGEHELLACVTLPYTKTNGREFAAIHSNPPGIATNMPSAVLKMVGLGKILWVAAPIERSRPYMSRKVVGRMIKELCGEQSFSYNAPGFVEVLGWDKDGKRYFAAINQQETSPITPVPGIEIILPYQIRQAKIAETDNLLAVEYKDGKTKIQLPVLQVFLIIVVE